MAYMRLRTAAISLAVAAATISSVASAQLPLPKHRIRPPASQTEGQEFLPLTAPANGAVNVDLTAAHVLNRFSPSLAIGAGVDAIGAGGAPTIFSTANINTMLGSGLGGLSYRLYTELNVQDWHWNPTGTW